MTTYFSLITRHAKCIITSKFRQSKAILSTCYDLESVFLSYHTAYKSHICGKYVTSSMTYVAVVSISSLSHKRYNLRK